MGVTEPFPGDRRDPGAGSSSGGGIGSMMPAPSEGSTT